MPRLEYYNPHYRKGVPERWVVRCTTPEDRMVVEGTQFAGKVNLPLLDGTEARRVLNEVNDRANKIRNPPRRSFSTV